MKDSEKSSMGRNFWIFVPSATVEDCCTPKRRVKTAPSGSLSSEKGSPIQPLEHSSIYRGLKNFSTHAILFFLADKVPGSGSGQTCHIPHLIRSESRMSRFERKNTTRRDLVHQSKTSRTVFCDINVRRPRFQNKFSKNLRFLLWRISLACAGECSLPSTPAAFSSADLRTHFLMAEVLSLDKAAGELCDIFLRRLAKVTSTPSTQCPGWYNLLLFEQSRVGHKEPYSLLQVCLLSGPSSCPHLPHTKQGHAIV